MLYRCFEIRVWPVRDGIRWEVSLLVQGRLQVLRGTVATKAELDAAVNREIAVAYKGITGSALPDGAR